MFPKSILPHRDQGHLVERAVAVLSALSKACGVGPNQPGRAVALEGIVIVLSLVFWVHTVADCHQNARLQADVEVHTALPTAPLCLKQRIGGILGIQGTLRGQHSCASVPHNEACFQTHRPIASTIELKHLQDETLTVLRISARCAP